MATPMGLPGNLPPDVPAEARSFLQEMNYLEPDLLKVGEQAPVIELAHLGGGPPVQVGGVSERPTVLVFGSYT